MNLIGRLRTRARRGASRVVREAAERLGYDPVPRGKYGYRQDGLITNHAHDFVRDPDFRRAYAAAEATGSWGGSRVHWRVHVILWAARLGMTRPGDFVECGTNRGGYARAILETVDLRAAGKTFWMFDTFAGLAGHQITERESELGIRPGGFDECYDFVVDHFRDEPVRIVRGLVPDTLREAEIERVAFLSIDMNVAEPEVAAAEWFWDRLSPGAPIVFDDYGWKRHAEQKRALDAFARGKGVEILSLPTGQGLIVRP